jgi:surface protein
LKEIDLSSFNTEKVTDMSFVFYNCWNLKNINLSSSFTMKNVTNKIFMFEGCVKLENIDLSLFEDKDIIIMKMADIIQFIEETTGEDNITEVEISPTPFADDNIYITGFRIDAPTPMVRLKTMRKLKLFSTTPSTIKVA